MKAVSIAKNQCPKLWSIDKKHITSNIHPEIGPISPDDIHYPENKHDKYISWFKAIKIDRKVFDISRWFEEQIITKKLDLELI